MLTVYLIVAVLVLWVLTIALMVRLGQVRRALKEQIEFGVNQQRDCAEHIRTKGRPICMGIYLTTCWLRSKEGDFVYEVNTIRGMKSALMGAIDTRWVSLANVKVPDDFKEGYCLIREIIGDPDDYMWELIPQQLKDTRDPMATATAPDVMNGAGEPY